MKLLLSTILLFLGITIHAQDTYSEVWHTDFEKAKTIAAETGKPLLLYFTGSDWCKPCKMLKADYFDTEEFVRQTQNVVMVLVDRPYRMDIISEEQMAKNKITIKKYNKQGSYPLMLALDKKGHVTDEISGYSGDPRYYREFVKKHGSAI